VELRGFEPRTPTALNARSDAVLNVHGEFANPESAASGVARAIVQQKTRVIDIDLRSYFDNVRHDRLLAKVGQRVVDADVMHLLKVMLKASATG